MQTLTSTAPAPTAVEPARTTPRAPRLGRVLCWLVPTVLTGLLVSFRMARPEPWRDELATWSAATRTVPQIFALGQHIDGVTVPYYLLAHVWSGWFGDSVTALRMPSVLAVTATTAVVALLARRLRGPRAALLAGLLFAVMPVASRFAQEARGYAFAGLFAALSTLLLLRALDRPARWWPAYAVSVLLLGWSHQIALLLLLGHGLAVAVLNRRHLQRWLPAVLLAAAGVLPFTLLGLGQRETQLDWLVAATPGDLAGVAGNMFISGIVGGAVCTLAALGLRADRDRRATLVFIAAVAPVLTLYLVDQLVAPIFVGRYLYFTVPLLCAVAGRALAGLRAPHAVAVVLVVGLVGLPSQEEMRRGHSGFDYRRAAAMVEANARPGDAIVYAPRGGWQFTDTALRYYLGDDLPHDVLRWSDQVRNASLWATTCPAPDTCLSGTARVWTLSADNLETGRRAGETDQLTDAERHALAPFTRLMSVRVDGFTLVLFERRPRPVGEPDEPTAAYRHWGPGVVTRSADWG
ncbi:glycosyltransferase family 39 protein [Actinoplanes sp. NPDC049118]|uniref:glycosyltransferase family 39 protein n=1 Tax=Actinoplanes sp. NPDC049118 TaxID=3155769 RepID=UPI0033D882A1